MSILKDKYFLMSLFCVFVLILFSFFDIEDKNDDPMIGIITDIKETQNGFVFDLIDADGDIIHCFSKERFRSDSVYEIKGRYSDDRTMFFIESFSMCQTS